MAVLASTKTPHDGTGFSLTAGACRGGEDRRQQPHPRGLVPQLGEPDGRLRRPILRLPGLLCRHVRRVEGLHRGARLEGKRHLHGTALPEVGRGDRQPHDAVHRRRLRRPGLHLLHLGRAGEGVRVMR